MSSFSQFKLVIYATSVQSSTFSHEWDVWQFHEFYAIFLFRKISKHQYFSHFHEKLGAEEEEPIGDRCRASVCCGRKIINAVIQFSVNNLHVSRRPKKIVLMHVQLRINFLVVFEVGN